MLRKGGLLVGSMAGRQCETLEELTAVIRSLHQAGMSRRVISETLNIHELQVGQLLEMRSPPSDRMFDGQLAYAGPDRRVNRDSVISREIRRRQVRD